MATQPFTLPKQERLYRKRAFKYLFEHGSSFRVGMLKFFYVINAPPGLVGSPLSVAFSAPKRTFRRAVDRNYLKRRMREGFRLRKYILLDSLKRNRQNIVLLVIYQSSRLSSYKEIEQALEKGLYKLEAMILSGFATDTHASE